MSLRLREGPHIESSLPDWFATNNLLIITLLGLLHLYCDMNISYAQVLVGVGVQNRKFCSEKLQPQLLIASFVQDFVRKIKPHLNRYKKYNADFIVANNVGRKVDFRKDWTRSNAVSELPYR